MPWIPGHFLHRLPLHLRHRLPGNEILGLEASAEQSQASLGLEADPLKVAVSLPAFRPSLRPCLCMGGLRALPTQKRPEISSLDPDARDSKGMPTLTAHPGSCLLSRLRAVLAEKLKSKHVTLPTPTPRRFGLSHATIIAAINSAS